MCFRRRQLARSYMRDSLGISTDKHACFHDRNPRCFNLIILTTFGTCYESRKKYKTLIFGHKGQVIRCRPAVVCEVGVTSRVVTSQRRVTMRGWRRIGDMSVWGDRSRSVGVTSQGVTWWLMTQVYLTLNGDGGWQIVSKPTFEEHHFAKSMAVNVCEQKMFLWAAWFLP